MSSLKSIFEQVISQLHAEGEFDPGVFSHKLKEKINAIAEDVVEDLTSDPQPGAEGKSPENRKFLAQLFKRWGSGFAWLNLLRASSIEAGIEFQKEFLSYPEYEKDPLFGVLMRIHAHSCRIMGEIIALLEAGYPDGAFARWRTLHENSVVAQILFIHGAPAAEDYICYGIVQSVNGMVGYQETCAKMKREPYSEQEMQEALEAREQMIEDKGSDFLSRNGWARKYVGASRFDKLQKAAGLSHWSNDYSIASKEVHSEYREMKSLLGMSEVSEEALLCGPSDSGFIDPAHASAIALSQITATFITARSGTAGSKIDYSASILYLKVLQVLVDKIGDLENQ